MIIILLSACQTTKYVPDKEFLLSKAKITVDNKDIDKKEMKIYLKQKPNTKILGFWRFHLWLYNLSSVKSENGWLKRIGEPPVIYNAYLTLKSKEEFKKYMQNKGFYQAIVLDTVLFSKKKRAEVFYTIIANQPSLVDSFKAVVLDDSIKAVLPYDSIRTLVRKNSRFDTDMLAIKSRGVLRYLQNNGFYKTDKSEIYFEADTFTTKNKASLKMFINKENISTNSDTTILKDHKRYTFRNFYYHTDDEAQKQPFSEDKGEISGNRSDTLKLENQYFIDTGKIRFKPGLLINSNHIADRKYYSLNLVERTYNELFALKLFKIINIRFTETGLLDSLGNPTLDCIIHLTPSKRQAFTVTFEGTNSLGNFGVAGNLGYQHKNLFRGGELLDVTLLGATERQSYGKGDSLTTFHSFESGIDTKLTLPKYLAPIRTKSLFRYSTPQTLIDVSYNYQNRPDFTRTILRASFGYQWKSSEYTTHRFNVLDLNLVKMFAYDSAFVSRIENLFIRSSYTDHSISAWNYSYTYNTQNIQKRSEYDFLRATAETAGNLLYGINKLFNKQAYTSDSLSGRKYHFLGTPFAQYLKTDLEYRKGIVIDKFNMVAFRGFGGIVIPYGNSDQVPFERKYFTGGANGIRAWPVRTLGPGSYKAGLNEFPNQTGDIKLEANAEYRFAIITEFEGAFFLDMGNIWSLKDNRPGTEFKLNRFYKEIAVGTGFGIRYDFSYVILRVDLGVKLRDPSLNEGERWIPVSNLLNKYNYNFTFGIGYPF
jgi:outer membrane translocation and assembly module TamA